MKTILGNFISLVVPLTLINVVFFLFSSIMEQKLFTLYSPSVQSIFFGLAVSFGYSYSFQLQKFGHFAFMVVIGLMLGTFTAFYPIFSINHNFLKNIIFFVSICSTISFVFNYIWFNEKLIYLRIFLSAFALTAIFAFSTSILNLLIDENVTSFNLNKLFEIGGIWFLLIFGMLNFADHLLIKLDSILNLNLYDYEDGSDEEEA